MAIGVRPPEGPGEDFPLLSPENHRLSRLAAAVAGSLFLAYFSIIVIAALPPRPLDPGWVLRMAGLLTDNAAIPLVGVVLLFMAAHFDPESPVLRARRNRAAGLARWVAIGFLLLIPAQLAASWTGVQQVGLSQGEQMRAAALRVAEVRKATEQATSTADLQARLQRIGASLNPRDLDQPIASLRPRYLKELKITAQQVSQQEKQPVTAGQQLVVAQGTVKGLLMALAYGLGFAAAAPGADPYSSMLLDWKRLLRRPGQPAGGLRKGDVNSSYMDTLSRLDAEEGGGQP